MSINKNKVRFMTNCLLLQKALTTKKLITIDNNILILRKI